ncbi:hypothetical protein ACIO3O_37085 [Streptomyces sp. NPDC087440]|uniref:hypothetical protein n=1 Tax=Streptomyces sp. NPDC087440 TaxID=3365790 RepID=UPI0037FDCC1D
MSEQVEGAASRRDRKWVVHVAQHGVYGHGGTLKAARQDTMEGLGLAGVRGDLVLRVAMPEVQQLRDAEDARALALREVVAALIRCRTTVGDIALVTGESARNVKLIIEELRAVPAERPMQEESGLELSEETARADLGDAAR